MPNPRLIHPVTVVVERYDTGEQVFDPDTNEPIHGARGVTSERVTIKAQIKWSAKVDPHFTSAGVEEKSDGYILCRRSDLRAAGGEFKRGDRILSIGTGDNEQGDLDVYILKEEPMGHWQDLGGSSLVKYHFQDRTPVKKHVVDDGGTGPV
jgi:hypothetical protein